MLQPHLLHTITSYQYGLFHDLAAIHRDWQAPRDGSDVLFTLNHECVFLDPVSVHKLHTPVDHPRFLLHFPILTGNVALFYRWLSCAGRDWVSPDTLLCAVHEGNLNIVQHLHEHVHVPCSADALEIAAANGHMDIVQYLHAHTNEPCSWRVIYKAAEYGHMDIVFWLNECPHCQEFTKCALDYAAGLGRVPAAALLLDAADHGVCLSSDVQLLNVQAAGRTAPVLSRFVELDDCDIHVQPAVPTIEDSLDFLLDRLETHRGIVVI
ncbi:hypothetical protein DYB37_001790 [Aphanomyces astaci]|uniref:Uncharacterized protein n=1 Tax=Aphanomyces astaci TaxID=112090 RepID=A0A3R7ALE4_APHAT|nr:hypothetical protein DYB35_011486 [Aphanomyces astaci]RHZ12891.1 hypothetical protein DYB37_001790 [Aphanomyces astaci]